MVLFKGRFQGRQHIKGKPKATGLKFFVLADALGYCYSMFLYKGIYFIKIYFYYIFFIINYI